VSIKLAETMTIQAGGARFEIRPTEYLDLLEATAWAKKCGIEDEPLTSHAVGTFVLMRRIVSWEGVCLADGTPAPVTDDTKSRLFAQNQALLGEIAENLAGLEESERKN